jgi:hypothetical protein
MLFSRIAEDRIAAAMRDGLFDDLPGRGEPVDLEEYFSAPEELRMAYSILKNANCVPTEVGMMNDVARLREAVASAPDAQTRQALQRKLMERQIELAIIQERKRINPHSRG